MAQQMIGEQIRFGQGDIRQLHAEVGRAFLGVHRFGAFAQYAGTLAIAQGQGAMWVAQVFEHLPAPLPR